MNNFASTTNSPGLLKDYYEKEKVQGDGPAQAALKKRVADMAVKVAAQSELSKKGN